MDVYRSPSNMSFLDHLFGTDGRKHKDEGVWSWIKNQRSKRRAKSFSVNSRPGSPQFEHHPHHRPHHLSLPPPQHKCSGTFSHSVDSLDSTSSVSSSTKCSSTIVPTISDGSCCCCSCNEDGDCTCEGAQHSIPCTKSASASTWSTSSQPPVKRPSSFTGAGLYRTSTLPFFSTPPTRPTTQRTRSVLGFSMPFSSSSSNQSKASKAISLPTSPRMLHRHPQLPQQATQSQDPEDPASECTSSSSFVSSTSESSWAWSTSSTCKRSSSVGQSSVLAKAGASPTTRTGRLSRQSLPPLSRNPLLSSPKVSKGKQTVATDLSFAEGCLPSPPLSKDGRGERFEQGLEHGQRHNGHLGQEHEHEHHHIGSENDARSNGHGLGSGSEHQTTADLGEEPDFSRDSEEIHEPRNTLSSVSTLTSSTPSSTSSPDSRLEQEPDHVAAQETRRSSSGQWSLSQQQQQQQQFSQRPKRLSLQQLQHMQQQYQRQPHQQRWSRGSSSSTWSTTSTYAPQSSPMGSGLGHDSMMGSPTSPGGLERRRSHQMRSATTPPPTRKEGWWWE